MKKIIFAILIISVLLLSGCVPGTQSMKSSAKYDKQTSEDQFEREEVEQMAPPVALDDKEADKEVAPAEEDKTISIKTIGDDSVTFKKLPDYMREKGLTEKCNIDFPFECSEYKAYGGVVYLTLKNQDYNSKFFDITLSLSGESCDPVETKIEPGQNKDFECYVDPDVDHVAGELEIEYNSNIYSEIRIRTGTLVVQME
ncbi:MAG: membrane lipoprotein lipid attachment site-containing protein [Candidatus Woesearchaeota archaeon]